MSFQRTDCCRNIWKAEAVRREKGELKLQLVEAGAAQGKHFHFFAALGFCRIFPKVFFRVF